MVTSGAMTSGGGMGVTPLHYKPFSSHAHYQQVMSAVRKLQESGFYFGAVSGRDASALLRAEPPGTFLIRDSSDHHHFFSLSVQTLRGIKNLRIHSTEDGFYLQRDPLSTQEPPHFDCVLKLIAHYMGKSNAGGGGGGGVDGAIPGNGRHVYLIHSGGEKVPLELRRPLCASMSSLQHLCRRTLNNTSLGSRTERQEQIPHTLKDFMNEYDAPI
ncbi:suppressor of cytokine signaling 3-like [Boleophthalmus pectinirostris]|uniref:suppressor of cytokine signaling 3-like n=1 Tax=Boleophthalmus pectinirostris TaxID=150288 RepID=UPI002430DD0F|nr:suppressor of cytokine signaling 3-like [Boleophthalmus pectinirostris]XP_055005819.1 suppressor of cytokine signaling 3-like [Boleophthalmus pectinirostris]XP_055005820.1 suppressor of cytokine signaling 3-like [Boleophthalmus pectinirostris]